MSVLAPIKLLYTTNDRVLIFVYRRRRARLLAYIRLPGSRCVGLCVFSHLGLLLFVTSTLIRTDKSCAHQFVVTQFADLPLWSTRCGNFQTAVSID